MDENFEQPYRNARYTQPDAITADLEHPVMGWLPFTAMADDVEPFGKAVFAYLATRDDVAAYVPIVLTPEDIRAEMRPLTPREFRDALIDNDIMPDQVTDAISQMSDPKARAKALNAWEYPTQFTRTDPLVDQIGTIFGLTPEKIDKLWTEAST